MLNNKKYLAIFDMDGTLFDTNDVNYYSYKDALAKYSVNVERDYFVNHCNGLYYKDFIPLLTNSNENTEDIHDLKKQLYLKNLDKAKCNMHLFNIINQIKEKYYIALVTTASKKNANDILEYFSYKTLFDLIITHEDIAKTKPDPEGFLKAIEHYNLPKENVIIFEDSQVGIEAARATGATVIVVNKF